MELRAADSTRTLAVPVIGPSCAVIVTAPADWPPTNPFGLTVAMALLEEVHVQSGLIHSTDPSVKLPLAAMPTAEPGASTAVSGDMVMEANVSLVTVRGVEPVALAPA